MGKPDFYETVEKSHGRIETRRYRIVSQLEWLRQRKPWPDLNTIGMVESVREIKGQTSCEVRFYISSPDADVQVLRPQFHGLLLLEHALNGICHLAQRSLFLVHPERITSLMISTIPKTACPTRQV